MVSSYQQKVKLRRSFRQSCNSWKIEIFSKLHLSDERLDCGQVDTRKLKGQIQAGLDATPPTTAGPLQVLCQIVSPPTLY